MKHTVICVVHYGPTRPTTALATALVSSITSNSHFTYEVCVIANDASVRPPNLRSDVSWLVPERNLGYGGAGNFALEQRSAEFLVLLNNDLSIDGSVVSSLVETLSSSPTAAVCAPVMVHLDGSYQSGPGTLTPITRSTRLRPDPGEVTTRCEWVTGAVLALNLDRFPSAPFDPSYFLGSEDVDLCVRAADAGWQIICRGDLRVKHELSTSIGPMWAYYAQRNRLWLVQKHYGRGLRWTLTALKATILSIKFCAACVLKGRPVTMARWHLLGLRDGLRTPPPRGAPPLPGEPIPLQSVHG